MDVQYCTTGSTVKTDNSLILVHQNIRGTASKTGDNGSFRMDKINPQVLCLTEHCMLDGNLCLTNIEDYVLGANFSLHNYHKDGVLYYLKYVTREILLQNTPEGFKNYFLNTTDNLRKQTDNVNLPILLL